MSIPAPKRQTLAERNRRLAGSPDYRLAEITEEFSCMVEDILEERGMTKADLAQRMGVSRAWMGKVLSGSHNGTLRTAVRVLAALDHDLVMGVASQASQRRASES